MYVFAFFGGVYSRRWTVSGKPAIVGTRMPVEYFSGPGYFEIDLNISDSAVSLKGGIPCLLTCPTAGLVHCPSHKWGSASVLLCGAGCKQDA